MTFPHAQVNETRARLMYMKPGGAPASECRTMTTRLTLLCHAATAATRAGRFPMDEELETAAETLAATLAGRLPRADRALSGQERRTRQTAAALGLDAEAIAGLDDCDFGLWRGRSIAGIAAETPAAVAAWLGDPDDAPHGGESVSALIRRVGAWLDAACTGGSVIAVTHPAVARAAALHALGAPAACFWRLDAGPLSVTDLRHDGRRWALRALPLALL